jgi:hypothetical protein
MKPASSELIALLQSRDFNYADTFTFYLPGGTDENYRLRYTNAQQDLALFPLDGDLLKRAYSSRQVQVAGLRARASIGVKVDQQTVTLSPHDEALIQGVPVLEAIVWGALDGATVRRDRYYWDGPIVPANPPVGGLPKFAGLVSTFQAVGRSTATLAVKSGLVKLDTQMPRHLTQPTCLNFLFNAACGLIAADFAVHGTVEAGATTTFLPWTAGSDAGFSLGRVFMQDENVVGVWRAIKSADAAGLTLAFPLPAAPATGERFVAYPGCDRTKTRHDQINSDPDRFRGFDFVPQAEKAI